MRKKRITIPRGSLSPFTGSAILQLMAEFNRKEDAKQCLELAKVFKERAAKLKKEPCRQPSKKKKRTEADKLKRAEAFAKLKAGTYIPVAVAKHLDEAAASSHSFPAGVPAPRPTQRVDDPVGSAFANYWAHQDAERDAREALGNARTAQQPDQPIPPASSSPAQSVAVKPIPKKGEPGYVTWLLTEIAKRKAAGTWTE